MAIITGTSRADRITADASDDTLIGLGGDDTLDGGGGNDSMAGGLDDDLYVVDSAGDITNEQAGEGADTLLARTTYVMGANIEIGRLFGTGTSLGVAADNAGPVQLVLNSTLASTVLGGAGDDVLWGGADGSAMFGRVGQDIMRDQGANTAMHGGLGDDQFVIGNLASVIVESAGEGNDTAWVTAQDYSVGDNVEITRLGGTANTVRGANTDDQVVANPLFASNLFGRGGNDVLWGSGFVDTLDGGLGDDIMRGQGGADIMIGGVGDDAYVVLDPGVQIFENVGEGYDTVWIGLAANVSFTLAANTERGNLSGAANRLIGNGLDNVLVGDAVASLLDGQGGNDIVFGGSFADTITGGAGNDDLYGNFGADYFVYAGIGWGADRIAHFSSADGAKLDFTGSGIGFAQLTIVAGGGNTVVTLATDTITVFGATLSSTDFIFG